MKYFFTICLLIGLIPVNAQKVELLNTGTKTSLRGLSVVTDHIIWVSGSNGTIGKSIDGGKTWKWNIIKGFEKRDFRDIEAFDGATAIVMAVAEPAYILKTIDGGSTWKIVYENKTKGMFLDAMEFWNRQSGIVLGDPIDNRFFIARTFDEGESWREIPGENLPLADSGEACFAASGTNLRPLNRQEACFVSGGLKSRFFWKGSPITLPVIQGKQSTGANSIAVRDKRKLKHSLQFIVVGGDFSDDTSSYKNCFLTANGGRSWVAPLTPPHGYKSCVEYISRDRLITCGTTGVDISDDGGMNWIKISNTGFHVCRKAKTGISVFLAGGDGRIGKLIW